MLQAKSVYVSGPHAVLDPTESLSCVFIDWATVDAQAELLQLILLSVLCLGEVCAHETRGSCGGCSGCSPSGLLLAWMW